MKAVFKISVMTGNIKASSFSVFVDFIEGNKPKKMQPRYFIIYNDKLKHTIPALNSILQGRLNGKI
jgi:hypothetical protein